MRVVCSSLNNGAKVPKVGEAADGGLGIRWSSHWRRVSSSTRQTEFRKQQRKVAPQSSDHLLKSKRRSADREEARDLLLRQCAFVDAEVVQRSVEQGIARRSTIELRAAKVVVAGGANVRCVQGHGSGCGHGQAVDVHVPV